MKLKQFVAGILLGATLMSPITTEGKSLLNHCRQIQRQEKLVKILDGQNLHSKKTWQILEGKGDLVIEIDYGVVTNNKKDGRVLNTTSKKYNYISYRRVKGARKGDVIMSVFIYSPDRRAYDDDLARYDWIIDRK